MIKAKRKIILISTTNDDVSGASKALIELAVGLKRPDNDEIV